MSLHDHDVYRFDEFELILSRRTLVRDGIELTLSPKAFEVLTHLVSNAGRLVTKEEMLRAVWPEAIVEEGNLSQQVSVLRKTLTDRSKYIVTIPGRGYQFTAKVLSGVPEQRPGDSESGHVDDGKRSAFDLGGQSEATYENEPKYLASRRMIPGWMWMAAAGAVLAIVLAAGSVYWLLAGGLRARAVRVSDYVQITHDGRDKFLAGTDGSRLYFTQKSPQSAVQVAVSGGVVAPVAVPIPKSWLGGVSPDGSTILLIAEAGGMTSAPSVWSFGLLGSPLRRLVDAVASTWSPDGKTIAYATQTGEVGLIQSDGTQARRLVTLGGFVDSLSWSPDGSVLRAIANGKLWEVSANGTNLHQLLGGWGKDSSLYDGSFATDGRFFFVAGGQIRMLEWGAAEALRAPVQLTSGPVRWDAPTPSRDAKTLFSVGTTRRGELVRPDAKSGEFVPFLGGISAEFVSFSRDGRSVAYVTYPDGVLWRANRDGSGAIQLTSPPVYPKLIRWSPDGSQILFVDRSATGLSQIYVVPSQGGSLPKHLLPEDTNTETDPNWSPDGMRVAFSTSPEEFLNPDPVLRILDVATRQVTTVVNSKGLYSPRWSPDGRLLVAATLDSLTMKVFEFATQHWSTLRSGPVAFPEWSHDSRSIYYVSWGEDPGVLRINATGGKIERVADLKDDQYTGFYSVWMGLDPEDTPLMLRDRGSHDIYALKLEEK